jgi:FKBP-type peptidyl-prolyl cis-trans isomerase SlyD
MTEQNLEVSDGLIVGLDYTLRLDDGEVIDTSEGRGPLEFTQGQNQIVPGLEQALYGMKVGEENAVVVKPGEGYGERDPEAMQVVPKDAFPEDAELEPGMGVQVSDGMGRTTVVFIADILPEGVKLDFNHPLAGETLHFQVKVASIRQPAATD